MFIFEGEALPRCSTKPVDASCLWPKRTSSPPATSLRRRSLFLEHFIKHLSESILPDFQFLQAFRGFRSLPSAQDEIRSGISEPAVSCGMLPARDGIELSQSYYL